MTIGLGSMIGAGVFAAFGPAARAAGNGLIIGLAIAALVAYGNANYVIGVCDEKHRQRCPLFPGVTQRIYWSFPDPASFEGAHSEKLARVVQAREAIRSRLDAWLSTLPVAATSSTTRTDLP